MLNLINPFIALVIIVLLTVCSFLLPKSWRRKLPSSLFDLVCLGAGDMVKRDFFGGILAFLGSAVIFFLVEYIAFYYNGELLETIRGSEFFGFSVLLLKFLITCFYVFFLSDMRDRYTVSSGPSMAGFPSPTTSYDEYLKSEKKKADEDFDFLQQMMWEQQRTMDEENQRQTDEDFHRQNDYYHEQNH
ncbi:hypothetical protein KO561_02650 [Radiobacillus kanasensis]|uniref:hypothetical protein n=1 Tax=Radiobacillus kanasensis TaxID=2844358 RepID=UPI001E285814|nr:hypothetical protein [Radiobacillus kanasensis]UFT99880.1 hypothetical protein KO561_02650 [Radiobacillus kanasensis]